MWIEHLVKVKVLVSIALINQLFSEKLSHIHLTHVFEWESKIESAEIEVRKVDWAIRLQIDTIDTELIQKGLQIEVMIVLMDETEESEFHCAVGSQVEDHVW